MSTKIIKATITITFIGVTFGSGWIFIKRLLLPYNSEGRYFDAESSVVYHQQAVIVYGLLFFILLLMTAGLAFRFAKAKK